MHQDIVTLRDRMARGGDWREFRDEIAALHKIARTEEEFVNLLEAYSILVAIGEECYSPEVYEKLLPVTRTEYRMMLALEAMEGESLNLTKMEYITRREMAAGRLDADDVFHKLAEAEASVTGKTADLHIRK